MKTIRYAARFVSLGIALAGVMGTRASAEVGVGRHREPLNRIGSYRGITGQGIRVDIGRAIVLDSIVIPVFAGKGDTAVVHVFGMERGAPAPVIEQDVVSPVVVRADTSGYQSVVVRFDPPVRMEGNQGFVVIDKASTGFRAVTVRDSMPATCQCMGEEYTQQVVRDSTGWKTAPLRFPWKLGVRSDAVAPALRMAADTLETVPTVVPATDAFFLAVTDVDNDGRMDVISPGGIFLAVKARRFRQIMAPDAMRGIGAVCCVATVLGSRTYMIGNAGASRLPVDVKDVETVVTPLDRVEFAAHTRIPTDDIRIVVVGTMPGSTRQHLLLVDPVGHRVIRTMPVEDLELHDIRSMAATVEHMQGGIVAVTGHDGRSLVVLTLDVDDEEVHVLNRTPRVPSAETFDIPGPGVSLDPSTGEPVLRHTPVHTMAGADIDRRTSVALADLDGDGWRELLETTSDTCRSMYMSALDTTTRDIAYADLSMMWGSADVGVADIDGNGMQDIVGFVAGRTMVLWNETTARSTAMVRLPRMYRNEEIVAVMAGERSVRVPTPMGTHGLNIVTNDAFVTVHGIDSTRADSVRTARGNTYDIRDVLGMDAPRTTTNEELSALGVSITPSPLVARSTLLCTGLQPGAPTTIDVADMSGRRVMSWSETAAGAEYRLEWNGADDQGHPLPGGRYQITVHCGNRMATCSILIVH